MKAWLFTGIDEPLQLVDRPDPVPGPNEVVLKVRGAGLCHSDVGYLDGTLTHMLPRIPIILGHEVAGTVESLGPGVTLWQKGDRVIAAGNEEYLPGWRTDGGYATLCIVNEAGLTALPDNISFIQGAAASDAGQTAYHGVMGTGEMKPGQRVGIIGLGGLGMAGARIAIINGAAEVHAAEPRKDVWDTALSLGVKNIVADVTELEGLNLDLIVDFAGMGTTTAGAIAAVRPGGIVSQVGLGRTESTISTELLSAKEVTLRGSRGGRPGVIQKVLHHISSGELEIETTVIPFEGIGEGLEKLRHGGVKGRLVADPNPGAG